MRGIKKYFRKIPPKNIHRIQFISLPFLRCFFFTFLCQLEGSSGETETSFVHAFPRIYNVVVQRWVTLASNL